MNKLYKTGFITVFVLCAVVCNGQQILVDSIGRSKLLKVSGGISAMTTVYGTNATANSRDPFNYFLTGNINVNVYGFNVPLSFSYSNRTFSYAQPFNQFSLHPSYKFIQTHVGWCSTSFSPYSISGHSFWGAAIETKPPKTNLTVSAMYGRLLKAIEMDSTNVFVLPTYKRMGYGAKLAYDKKASGINMSYFSAADNRTSLKTNPSGMGIFPESNHVATAEIHTTIWKQLRFSTEYGISIFNRDVYNKQEIKPIPGTDIKDTNIVKSSGGQFKYHAIKANLSYTIPKLGSSLGIGFERIDPGYRTLGTYFFNNDFQNLTVNFSKSFAKNKVMFSGNIGVQNDDLKKNKISNMQRVVHSYALNVTPSRKLNSSLTYSNFSAFTRIKQPFQLINQVTPYDNWDTLSLYRQVSQTASINMSYQMGASSKQQSLALSLTFQDTKDQQGNVVQGSTGSKFTNANVSYNITISQSNTNISVATNLFVNRFANISNMLAFGPTLVITQPFFNKKLPVNFSTAYNVNKVNNINQGSIINLRLGANYVYQQKHAFNISMVTLMRKNATVNNTIGNARTIETTAQLGYNYNF